MKDLENTRVLPDSCFRHGCSRNSLRNNSDAPVRKSIFPPIVRNQDSGLLIKGPHGKAKSKSTKNLRIRSRSTLPFIPLKKSEFMLPKFDNIQEDSSDHTRYLSMSRLEDWLDMPDESQAFNEANGTSYEWRSCRDQREEAE